MLAYDDEALPSAMANGALMEGMCDE